mgnify:CR=1 FL=1
MFLRSHRRENFGKPLENICNAIKKLVEANKDIEVVYPMHLNPNVRNTVKPILEGLERVKLIEPLDYVPFCNLMKKSHIILTDSGGVQEEAPALGVPVLVLRDETERPEAVEAGTVKIAGVDEDVIYDMAKTLLNDKDEYNKMAKAVNPYGDGHASERIVKAIIDKYSK